MEGPTPVSALIHAATMVTAGVYLVVRSNFIFELTPDAQTVVVIVATVTLLWGAIIGCAKDDIKKALAGSTMSQIGYMMLAAGLGVAGYAVRDLPPAHARLLQGQHVPRRRLGHARHGRRRRHAPLRRRCARYMPVTFLTFAMGYLAIIGFPGFSGFWSKDKIIETALAENWVVGLCALLGAGITGFYMTRLMLMTFFGEKRWEKDVHPHESPKVMTVPLIVLAALSVLGGVLLLGDWIVDFLAPVAGDRGAPRAAAARRSSITLIVVVVVAVGVAAAWFLVGKRDGPAGGPAGRLLRHPGRPRRPLRRRHQRGPRGRARPAASSAACATFDRYGVDGVVEGGSAARRRHRPACSAGSRTASSAPTPSPCSAACCSSSWPCWR